MRLSTRSTYGLRALCELALNWEQGPVSVSAISQKERLSIAYLEKLLNLLKHYGFVRSIRGSKGGYVLARDPGEISVGEIIRALEGEGARLLYIEDRLQTDEEKNETPASRMISLLVKRLGMIISESLNSLSLKRLCSDPEVWNLIDPGDKAHVCQGQVRELAHM
ncbi:MAG: Rrf2 family transcriptional regulator [Candidatus Omnitrophica bacterium]|nr:Rrf2 family transcriptional regulator [Candidatus Omnitrophota bacterium]